MRFKFFIFAALLAVVVFGQSDSQISAIHGRWGIDSEIRTAFSATQDSMDTRLKLSVLADSINAVARTVTATWIFSDSIGIGSDGAYIGTTHADTVHVYETVTNVNGILTVGSDPGGAASIALSDADTLKVTETVVNVSGGLTVGSDPAGGASITQNHADTLSVTEANFNINGALTVGSDPSSNLSVLEDVSTAGGYFRWVQVEIDGTTGFVPVYASADTSGKW